MAAKLNMGRALKVARDLIRQRAVEYPEDHEISTRLWRLLLDSSDDAPHLLGFMIREADRIGRIEEREAIMDVLRHIPYSLRYSPSSSEETTRSSPAAGPSE